MADPRAHHFRQLRRLRRSARRWSVLAGTLTAATAVLLPYHGIGLPDVFWAAGAGGSGVLAWWRLAEARDMAARPAPPPPDPALSADRTRQAIESFLAALPGGRTTVNEVRRAQSRIRLRGLSVADGWRRLDHAAQALRRMSPRLGPAAQPALLEAAAAERSLREAGLRTGDVERALRFAPPDVREQLDQTHAAMLARFDDGVSAYERMVAAAAGCVAEDGPTVLEPTSMTRLAEATDLLRGIAGGLSELRRYPPSPSVP